MTDQSEQNDAAEATFTQFSRRTLLRSAAAAGAALALPQVVAACGDGGGSSQTGAATTSGTPASKPGEPGGTFRFALAYDSSAGTFDPAREIIDADGCRRTNTFDTLMALRPDHTAELRLAESVEGSADLMTYTVKLRSGVLFHDGKKLTADDLIYSIKRILDPKTASGRATFLASIDPLRIRKIDPLTVELKLKRPDNDLPLAFALTEVVQDGATDNSFKTKPVGTGPFKVVSVNMGREVLWERFADYWHPGQPMVDRLHLTVIPDATARVNALTGGQVDAIERVPPAQFSQLASNDALKTIAKKSNAMVPFTMMASQAPFTNPDVRKAIRLIVDRPQLVEAALSGYASVSNDLYGQGQALYAADIPQRQQDLEQAKALLKKAGISGTPLVLTASDAVPGMLESATAFVQQASQADLTVKIRKVPADSFFGDQYPYRFGQSAWGDNPLPQFFQLALVKGAPFAEVGWSDPAWQRRFLESQAATDAASKKAIYHDLQLALWNQGGYVQWGDTQYLDATASKVNGISDHPQYPLGSYDFRTVTVR